RDRPVSQAGPETGVPSFPGNELPVDFGAAGGKQFAHRGRKELFVLAGIDLEKDPATRLELSIKQIVEEKIPLIRSPGDGFVGVAMKCGRESRDQIELSSEIRQRLKPLFPPYFPPDSKEIEELGANRVVLHVEADSGVTELFGDEQKKTRTAAKVENFLGSRPIQLQSPDARKIST